MIFGWKKKKTKPVPQAAPAPVNIASASPDELLLIACQNDNASTREQAFAKITDQSQLANIIEQGKFPDMRLRAAEQLSDETALRQAYAAAKQKDKNAARVLKEKLKIIDAKRQKTVLAQLEIDSILNDLKNVSTAAWTPSYNARYLGLLSRWQRLDIAQTAAMQPNFDTFKTQIEAVLAANQSKIDAPKDQIKICDLLEQICCACQQATLIEAQIACIEWSLILEAQSQAWRDTNALVKAEDTLKQRYLSASQSLLSAIQLAKLLNKECQVEDDFSEAGLTRLNNSLATTDWHLDDKPVWFGELMDLTGEVKRLKKLAIAEEDEQRGEIHKLFSALRRAIEAGRLQPAKKLSAKLEHMIHQSELTDTTRYLEQLENLNEQLSKLLDWNSFATTPKFEELCLSMEQLVTETIEQTQDAVDARVTQIKTLQDHWKELGRSDVADVYWARFQEAGHNAYEPAKTYFDVLRQKRAENLTQREQLCEQLSAALVTAEASQDWKSLEKKAASTQREWHKYRGVERKAGKAIKARLDTVLAQIQQAIAPQYEASIHAKETLISRMQKLAEQEISQHVIHQTKDLQTAWKLAGVTPREQDQNLWQQFNGFSKQIFDAERAQRQEKRREENSQFELAKQYTNDVKQLAANTSPDVLDNIQQAFNALPIDEDRGYDKIRSAFDRACDGHEQKRSQLHEQAQQQDFTELERRASLCMQLELANNDAEKETLLSHWDDYPLDNKTWAQAIARRKDQALNNEQATPEATTHRQLMCIQLEIALEQTSPNEDKAMRMAYQLERLQNRNETLQPVAQLVTSLHLAWLLDPPAEPPLAQALNQRFEQLLALAK